MRNGASCTAAAEKRNRSRVGVPACLLNIPECNPDLGSVRQDRVKAEPFPRARPHLAVAPLRAPACCSNPSLPEWAVEPRGFIGSSGSKRLPLAPRMDVMAESGTSGTGRSRQSTLQAHARRWRGFPDARLACTRSRRSIPRFPVKRIGSPSGGRCMAAVLAESASLNEALATLPHPGQCGAPR